MRVMTLVLARRNDVACFRVYDADMPEYAFAIDLYGNDSLWACVQEYAAPPSIAPEAARARRDEALAVIPEVLGIAPERMVLRVETATLFCLSALRYEFAR